jgi:hypothetical protein
MASSGSCIEIMRSGSSICDTCPSVSGLLIDGNPSL